MQEWTRQIENWLAAEHDDAREGEWYAGRPVLVMANDYAIGLFNGDTGRWSSRGRRAIAGGVPRAVGNPSGSPRRRAEVQTVHAMAVRQQPGQPIPAE